MIQATLEDLNFERPYIIICGKKKRNPIYYQNLKRFWVKTLGNKCQKCGYDNCINALEFHHEDMIRDRKIRQEWRNRKWNYDGVSLLCANCHAEEHSSHGHNFKKFNS